MKKFYKNNISTIGVILILILVLNSCKKESKWLEVKNNNSTVVPETLVDFQAILDNTNPLNNQYSTAGLVGADNFYLTDISYSATSENSRNLYVWNKVIWATENSSTWNNYFVIIEYANVVLDGLQKINDRGNEYNNVKGQALFHRAIAYYNLVQLFCKAYNATAASDLGLPIRLSSDVNIVAQRSTLSETYQQIINDAKESSALLPNLQPYVQRPLNSAGYALLSKVYLNMGDYKTSENYASKCLNLNSKLLDYNDTAIVSPNSTYRFPEFAKNNPEVLFYAQGSQFGVVWANSSSSGVVSSDLYQSYDADDLRKILFYDASGPFPKFRGSYTGNFANFCGLATNEIYLLRAECYAREGNVISAMADLNSLLIKRHKKGTFLPVISTNSDEALNIILKERRKELPFVSNIRWEDLKRLNKESRFQTTLSRIVKGITYTLAPNDKRYVLPIPTKEIQLTGIMQNER